MLVLMMLLSAALLGLTLRRHRGCGRGRLLRGRRWLLLGRRHRRGYDRRSSRRRRLNCRWRAIWRWPRLGRFHGLGRFLGRSMLRTLGAQARRFSFLGFRRSCFAGVLGGSFPGGTLSRLLRSRLLLRRCV